MASKSLLLREQFSDVTIKVQGQDGYRWRFPAHSLILRASSDWFSDILDEQALISPEQLAITFVDVSHETVIHLLRYIYTEELAHIRSPDLLLQLLKLSVKCRLWPLQSQCESKFQSLVTVRNACGLLEKASDILACGDGSTVVVEACRRTVLGYAQVVFSSESILEMGLNTLQELVRRDDLNVVDEDTVFTGLWHWGQRRCCRKGVPIIDQNIVDCLVTVLPHVRFSFIKNLTILPKTVSELYCKCLKNDPVESSCCFAPEIPRPRCRQTFKQPRDLLRQSRRCLLLENWKSSEHVSGVSRLLCAQLSFEADVFLVAVEVATLSGPQKSPSLSLIAEETGIELQREEIQWDESGRNQFMSSVLRFRRPVPVPRRAIHSLYLVLPSTDLDEGWKFPSAAVLRRTNTVLTDEGPVTVTVHSNIIQATISIYFLLAGRHL